MLTAKQMADFVRRAALHAAHHRADRRCSRRSTSTKVTRTGVRGDVAFAQSILETARLREPRRRPGADTTTTSPASVGATPASTASTSRRRRPACARRCSVAHLRRPRRSPTPTYKDPILSAETLKLGFRGKVQTWWDLWGTWATGAFYGQRVYDIYERMVDVRAARSRDADAAPATRTRADHVPGDARSAKQP